MNTKSIALLSSDINNKIALSLLFDKQGHHLVFVNEGKLADLASKQYSEMDQSDFVLIDTNIGLGDTGKTINEIIELLVHKELVFLCDSVTAKYLNDRELPDNVMVFEKPVLPDELNRLLTIEVKQH